MNTEKMIFEIIAKSNRSQTGDVSEYLRQQGFFDEMPKGLSQRDKNVTGNPVDVKKEFYKQNPK